MSRPLPYGDPAQLGPFRLTARLDETVAGIVYLGDDGDGRQVSVAVLTRGAAGDAAARDRFRAAINEAIPGRVPGGGWVDPGDRGGPAPVVAAQPEGAAPWVATAYEPERAGAERFLDSVSLRGAWRVRWPGRRRGPQFQPYWSGASEPAVGSGVAGFSGFPPAERRERGLVAAIVTLAAMLGLLAVLLTVLYACQPVSSTRQPPSDPPSETYEPPAPPPPSPSPSPSRTPSPSPSPGSPGSSGSPSPSGPPPDDGGGDGGNGGPV